MIELKVLQSIKIQKNYLKIFMPNPNVEGFFTIEPKKLCKTGEFSFQVIKIGLIQMCLGCSIKS